MDDKTECDASTGAELRSSFNIDDDFCEAKNLKEKYLKEIKKQKMNKTNNLLQSDPELYKAKSIPKVKNIKI